MLVPQVLYTAKNLSSQSPLWLCNLLAVDKKYVTKYKISLKNVVFREYSRYHLHLYVAMFVCVYVMLVWDVQGILR